MSAVETSKLKLAPAKALLFVPPPNTADASSVIVEANVAVKDALGVKEAPDGLQVNVLLALLATTEAHSLTPPGEEGEITVKLDVVTVAGSIGSLNVTTTGAFAATPVAFAAGDVFANNGATVSSVVIIPSRRHTARLGKLAPGVASFSASVIQCVQATLY